MATEYPPTPELDKRKREVLDPGLNKVVQDFYDWLTQEKGYVLARYVPEEERFEGDGIYGEQPVAVHPDPEQMMAEFFGIDLAKIEAERRAILEYLRSDEFAKESAR